MQLELLDYLTIIDIFIIYVIRFFI